MSAFLESLKRTGDCHDVAPEPEGFAIFRRSKADARAFNDLAREAIRRSGDDHVALPSTDGLAGYDRVFIIPLD